MHGDPVELGAGWGPRPSAAQQRDRVAPARQPPEDLVQVDLGPARLRVIAALPIDHRNAQRPRRRRAVGAHSRPIRRA
jgi:hypothetical protein